MTACFTLMKALRQQPRLNPEAHCTFCVYFSKNLDKTQYSCRTEKPDHCGLGLVSGDACCVEMRTSNCSTRKRNMKRVSLRVEGITCPGCALDVETVLKNSDGIVGANASYASGQINVDFDAAETGENQVHALIRKLGLKHKA